MKNSRSLPVRPVLTAVTLALSVLSTLTTATAGEIFFDDFSDGDVTNDDPVANDGTPVRWTELQRGNYDASSGDYVFTPPSPLAGPGMSSQLVDFNLTDTSIRVLGTVLAGVVQDHTPFGPFFPLLGVEARAQGNSVLNPAGFRDAYSASIGYARGAPFLAPGVEGTLLSLGAIKDGREFLLADDVVLPFDIREEDAFLQLDVIGDRLEVWGWRAVDAMPAEPQISVVDHRFASGSPGLWSRADSGTSIFRTVQVADTSIRDLVRVPEPSCGLLMTIGAIGICHQIRRR